METRKISQAVIRRLPRYYRYLGELLEDGVERISSNDLSKRMKLTASQIRQDLNNFGGFGQQGYGYNPTLRGMSIRDVPVRMMSEMKDFIKENNIEIAVLTIPKECAIDVAKDLVDAGIQAIWNFAHVDLNVPDNVIVESVHLSESLMRLSYNISRYNEDHADK